MTPPRRVAVDIHIPVELQIRTPTRQWQFEILDDHERVAYTGLNRSRLLEDGTPQCIPGWMPAVLAYVGFETADSGVLRQ